MNLDEIREAALAAARAAYAPQVIEIPGFEDGQTIQVVIRRVDMEPIILRTLGNPVLAALERSRGEAPGTGADLPPEEMAEAQRQVPDLLRAVCRQALVAPTWDEFEAVGGLTLDQMIAITEKAAGRLQELSSFRSE